MVTIRDLIERLGGGAAVARSLQISPSAVSLWMASDRVPPGREVTMWRMAQEAGVDWVPPGAEGLSLVKREAA